jgi:hypothetical protein
MAAHSMEENKEKWIIFRYMTKLFKNTSIKPAFWTTNTIKNLLQSQPQRTNKFNNAGVYKLKYKDCPLQYIS